MPERPMGDFGRDIPKPREKKNIKEMIFLAEQAAQGKIKVLPGKEWSFHYAAKPEQRAATIKGLIEGRVKPEDATSVLKPDVLIYNASDLESQGLEAVQARILDASSMVANYDYGRYANFISRMGGKDINFETVNELYNGITKARIQKKVKDAQIGRSGQQQMEAAMRADAEQALTGLQHQRPASKVLSSLKIDWMCEDLRYIQTTERDTAIAGLTGTERNLFAKLSDPYRSYVHSGDEAAYNQLVEAIKEGVPNVEKQEQGQGSESMEELDKELEGFKEQAAPPGTPEDPAIPPEDKDEYHTPESNPGESKEKVRSRPIFEIEPPLGGYYASGRKSYYDIDAKTWSKKKQTRLYKSSISDKSHKISGITTQGIKSLPLPNGYALDATTLKAAGAQMEILRDQNGCFYVQSAGNAKFSIEFGKDDQLFIGPPVPEDTALIYRGRLSDKTENQIQRSAGSAIQKAKQVQAYILANHFYPGGGDLEKAGALQLKLRQQSTGDNYLQNIDASEYLECYSSNTLGIAMVRKLGVPARLVIGHKVEGAIDGKSQITESTGHAWSEFWDGQKWVRVDFTPAPKPEDKKDDDKKSDQKKESDEEAQDDGTEQPQSQQQQQQGEQQKGKQEKSQQSQESQQQQSSPDQMQEASEEQVKQAESQLEQAKETLNELTEQKEKMDMKVDEAKTFDELKKLQEELEKTDLLDEMKEDLQDKLESKEEQMKQNIKEQLDKMVDDGFLDEKKREELEKMLEEKEAKELDRIKQQIEQENRLYNEYDDIREEVMPLVDQWFEYFIERLPRKQDIEIDEDSLTRQGAFNRRSVNRARNLIFGTIKNPRVIRSSVEPLFLASVTIDVSGSMQGQKLNNARKLLVFYSELFSRINETFGYLRFSINVFSDSIKEVKTYDQEYDSPKSYDFSDGERSTVKVRLMKNLQATGGTNMLDAIKKAATDLNEQTKSYPDYASAFYFVGDGEDTNGNSGNVKRFLEFNDKERGFGDHMRSAIMLGNESQRQTLAQIFGDEHTTVAPDFDALIEQSMLKLDDDIEEYLAGKTI